MAAPTAADYATATDNLIALRDNSVLNENELLLMQTGVRALVGRIQEMAKIPDGTAQGYLNSKRAFVANLSGVTQTILFNGSTISLANNEIVCTDPQEKSFFLEKNPALTTSTLAAWVATGTIRTFFW